MKVDALANTITITLGTSFEHANSMHAKNTAKVQTAKNVLILFVTLLLARIFCTLVLGQGQWNADAHQTVVLEGLPSQ